MYRRYFFGCVVALLTGVLGAQGHTTIHITHQYANINAQSLIGLPMGDYKTIVDKRGNLHWSEWSLKRRGQDVPFGFSNQMDGAVDVQLFLNSASGPAVPLKVTGQELYRGRYPFVMTRLGAGNLKAEELAFSTCAPKPGMDVIRIRLTNEGATDLNAEARMSGKRRNLPAFAAGSALATRDGYLVALSQSDAGAFSSAIDGLELDYKVPVSAHSSTTLWVKRPYDLPEKDQATVASLEGSSLLRRAVRFWQDFWDRGMKINLPEKEIDDFYDSSLAYVFILTERDSHGDLWTLDGPAEYVHYWGRGEYFQARAMENAGYLDIARQTVEHAFRLQKDDGEWDWPAISGWPAWDNAGGEAASVWDYYLFSRDNDWLRRAYPHLLALAQWIDYHREETEAPADAPAGAEPVKRQIPWSCKKETSPPLKPGEKPYWWGLLPWGYGDSGLPEGHNFPANVMCLYAIKCAERAAVELGHPADAARLSREYASYKQAILTSIHRSVQLEREGPPYLPAMPTDPEAAISQSFLAVYPTRLFSPDDPLVTGLLTRMERSELQGLPSNMAWMGASGVWPGELMNVAETYLRRGDVQKTVNMLIAALNHSYTTNVWKEEIKVDNRVPVACVGASAHKNIPDGRGTGDMPEAWGNANLVNLVRDMLLLENGRTLYLLSGIPADWIEVGEAIGVQGARTTLGGAAVSFRLIYPAAGKMSLLVTPPAGPVNVMARFPIGEGHSIQSAEVNGQPTKNVSGSTVSVSGLRGPATITIQFR
ncbi:MAG: hypothetical protein ACRD3O_06535 [Terriglobia bacterium]